MIYSEAKYEQQLLRNTDLACSEFISKVVTVHCFSRNTEKIIN